MGKKYQLKTETLTVKQKTTEGGRDVIRYIQKECTFFDKPKYRREIDATKRRESLERLEHWRTLTPEQQIEELDRRLGKGVGATRQRKRLANIIANRGNEQPKPEVKPEAKQNRSHKGQKPSREAKKSKKQRKNFVHASAPADVKIDMSK